jgi:putative intracellular protease/amidase/RNA polymerase-binding transcription factor DksA
MLDAIVLCQMARLGRAAGIHMLDHSIVEPGGILRVTPSGALTAADFAGLTRFADTYLATHGVLGGLLIEARAFPGWASFAALAAHLRFVRDHQRHVERIAVVTDSPIAHLVELLAKPFLAADIRLFAFDRQGAALGWLRNEAQPALRVLVVLTSHGELGATGRRTGFWLEELAAPYYVFKDAGAIVTLASPKGGQPPLDPASDVATAASPATARFKADATATAQLARTALLRDVAASDFDAVFYPGGHGPLWDLAEDPASIALIEATVAAGKPVAAVCHAPGVLRHVQSTDGEPLVRGKAVTGFSDTEEAAVGLTAIVPFLVEDMLIAEGGRYSKAPDWQVHVVSDGLLVTGQNPASSGPAAQALLALATGRDAMTAPKSVREPAFLASQRARLEALRAELSQNTGLGRAEADEVEAASRQNANEVEESAQDLTLAENDRVLSSELGRQRLAIDRALAKLDDGTYGFSDTSGLPISIARLQAVPQALRTLAEEAAPAPGDARAARGGLPASAG